MSKLDAFTQALRQARLAEAAQLEAVTSVRDARSLRLAGLRDALKRELAGHEEALLLFDLNLQDSPNPKLWLDLISFVEMEPDPKTYRLMQDNLQGREILFETADSAAMQAQALRHIAHRVVQRDKMAAHSGLPKAAANARYGLGELIYVWLTGLAFGLLAMAAWALATGLVKF